MEHNNKKLFNKNDNIKLKKFIKFIKIFKIRQKKKKKNNEGDITPNLLSWHVFTPNIQCYVIMECRKYYVNLIFLFILQLKDFFFVFINAFLLVLFSKQTAVQNYLNWLVSVSFMMRFEFCYIILNAIYNFFVCYVLISLCIILCKLL